MANTLTKDGSPFIPGSPGYPPSDPGTAGHPAYCLSVVTQVPQYKIIQVPFDSRPTIVVEIPPATPGAVRFVDANGREHWYKSIPNPQYGYAGPISLYVGEKTVVTTQCYPATPGVPFPGIPERPSVPANYNLGWSGSAVSIEHLAGRGTYTFSVLGPCVGVITGFNDRDEGSSYFEIDHGLSFAGSRFRVMEGGVYKTAAAAFATSDVFKIIRGPMGAVYYVKNGSLVYTSASTSAGEVFVDCSLYSYGDQIRDASLSVTIPSAYANHSAAGVGTIDGLTSFSTNGEFNPSQDAAGIGVLPAMVGTAYATVTRAAGVLDAMTGQAVGGYGDGSHYFIIAENELGPMLGFAEANAIAPPYCIANGEIPGMVGFALAHTGQSAIANGILPGLTGFSTDTTGAYQREGLIDGMVGEASVAPWPPIAFGYGELAALEGQGFGQVDIVVDPDGNPATYGGHGNFAALEGHGYGGGVGRGSFAALTGAASAVLTIVGTGIGSFGAIEGVGAGVLTFVGKGSGSFAALTGTSYGGGSGLGELAALEGTASGFVGLVGRGLGNFAPLEGIGLGVVGLVGRGLGEFAALEQVIAGSGLGDFAALEGIASGLIVVTATYEGYNFTLVVTKDGLTTYPSRVTTFPFHKIVRFKDRYIGVAADGLYVLGGDTFAGSPIVSDVITAETDFSTDKKVMDTVKRPRSMWLDGRFGNDLEVSMISSELENDAYGNVIPSDGAGNCRVIFGRGVRARHWGYRFRNVDGEDFMLNGMSPEIDVLKRMR